MKEIKQSRSTKNTQRNMQPEVAKTEKEEEDTTCEPKRKIFIMEQVEGKTAAHVTNSGKFKESIAVNNDVKVERITRSKTKAIVAFCARVEKRTRNKANNTKVQNKKSEVGKVVAASKANVEKLHVEDVGLPKAAMRANVEKMQIENAELNDMKESEVGEATEASKVDGEQLKKEDVAVIMEARKADVEKITTEDAKLNDLNAKMEIENAELNDMMELEVGEAMEASQVDGDQLKKGDVAVIMEASKADVEKMTAEDAKLNDSSEKMQIENAELNDMKESEVQIENAELNDMKESEVGEAMKASKVDGDQLKDVAVIMEASKANVEECQTEDDNRTETILTGTNAIDTISAVTVIKPKVRKVKKTMKQENKTGQKNPKAVPKKLNNAKGSKYPCQFPKKRFKTIKKSLRGIPLKRKLEIRDEKRRLDEISRSIIQQHNDFKEQRRKRRLENAERRLANERRAEIVQVIKNPNKLKQMKKKQMRMIEKRDISQVTKIT